MPIKYFNTFSLAFEVFSHKFTAVLPIQTRKTPSKQQCKTTAMWNNRRSKIVLKISEISSQILQLMENSNAGPNFSNSKLKTQIKELHQAGKSTQLFAHCLCYLRSTSLYHAEPFTKLKVYSSSWLLFWENISKSTCWSQNVPCKPRQPISSNNVLSQRIL